MKQECLENCREFYATCVQRGRIPVNKWNGFWHYSSSPEAFDNYLAKFNADDRKQIVNGLPHPTDSPTTRVKSIADKIPKRQIASLLSKLQEEDPDEYDRLMRDLRCSMSQTSPS